MIKRKSKPVSIILAISMLLSAVPAMADYDARISSVARLDEYSVNTPPEYTFQVEGNGKTFILLESKEGTNYILAKEHYKWAQYDPDETQKFDLEDPNNVAHWLNNEFLKIDPADSNKLPEEMLDYIEEHTYKIEPGAKNGNAPEPYEVTAKITFLSATEWKQYNRRFGIVDAIPKYGWWLRTGSGGSERYMLWSSNDSGDGKYVGDIAKVTAITSGSYGGARPSFHLSDEFFKHNRVNIDTVGEVVKDEIFSQMSYADFTVYTDDELRFLGVKDVPARIRIKSEKFHGNTYNLQEVMPFDSVSVMTAEASAEVTVCTDKGERILLKTDAVNGEAKFATAEYGLIKSVETDGKANELILLLPSQPEGFEINSGETLYGAIGVRNIDAYSVLMNYGYVNDSGLYTVDTMSITSDGVITSSWKPLCSDNGKSALSEIKRRYALVDRTDDTSLILFRTKLNKGKVSVKRFCLESVEEDISFISDWDPYYLLEKDGEQITVGIKISDSIPRRYTVKGKLTYRLDGKVKELETVSKDVKPNLKTDFVLKLSDLRYGNADVEVAVYDGRRLAAQYNCEVCVYEPYEKKYFNKYTTGSINEMKSNRHPERPTAEIMEIANKLGFYATRMDPEWLGVEQIRGIYDFDGSKYGYSKHLYDKTEFMWSPITIAYNNPIYSDGDGKDNVDKPDEVQAYVDFAVNSALNYSDVQHFEFWNEPNFSTYWTGASPYEYASVVKTASSFMREVRSDLNLSAGSIDVSRNGIGYSKTLFDAGIYDYIDNFSTHPYYHPQKGDGVFESKTKSYMSIVEENGGWKDVDLTEIGWMGSDFGDNSLDLTQAEEIPKIIAVSDGLGVFYNIYCMYSKPAQRFNFLRLDYSARPSCASTSNFFNNFGGAEFLFRYQPNDTAYIYCYKRDGKYTLVAWDSQGDTTLTFDIACDVDDIYGNSIGRKSAVKLIEAPQYIKNVSSNWILDKYVSSIKDEIKRFINKNDAILTADAKEQMQGLSDKIVMDTDVEMCERPYTIGLSMMEDMGDSVFEAQNKQMLYELHRIGEMIIKLYGCNVKDADSSAISEYDSFYNKYTSKLTYNTDRLPFTHDILRYAGREIEELEYLLSERGTTPDTKMFMSNRNMLAKQLMRWAEYTMAKEDIVYLDTTFSMLPAQGSAIEGKDFKVDVSVFNSTFDEKLAGKLEVINTEGMVVATVDNVRIQARSHTTVNTVFPVTENKLNEQMFYTMRYTCGERSYESVYPITKIPQVEVKLMNSEVGADSMRDIKYELTNLMPEAFDMTLKVTAPDGWEVKDNVEVTLQPNEKKIVSVPVNSVKQTAFNHYPINLEIVRDTGHTIYNETQLLNFTVSSKISEEISPAEFTGDISDWSNAYPYYIAMPEDFMSGSEWRDSELNGRVFSKYDENNLYFLVDVYDETHTNTKSDISIWDGDAVQIAFDILDTNSGAYDSDDYELCTALTSNGVKVWNHYAGDRNNTGARPSEWANVVRNDETKTTRYLIKIPKSDITPFETKAGNSISLDIALADSDLLENRESAATICGTIVSGKNTVPFIKWHLVGKQEALTVGMDEIEKIFPTK